MRSSCDAEAKSLSSHENTRAGSVCSWSSSRFGVVLLWAVEMRLWAPAQSSEG